MHLAWMRHRSDEKQIIWVKGHSGIGGNVEANRLANEGARLDQVERGATPNTPTNAIPSGTKLVALSERCLPRHQDGKPPHSP